MQEISQKVWTPLTGDYKVSYISSDMEHIGNRIAEGDLHPSMFWPEMTKAKIRLANRCRQEYLKLRSELERKEREEPA